AVVDGRGVGAFAVHAGGDDAVGGHVGGIRGVGVRAEHLHADGEVVGRRRDDVAAVLDAGVVAGGERAHGAAVGRGRGAAPVGDGGIARNGHRVQADRAVAAAGVDRASVVDARRARAI